MSLGLCLIAKLAARTAVADQLISRTEQWILRNYEAVAPITRQWTDEASTSLFWKLHPAAEEIELALIDPEHLVVSAHTTTVGPGYHVFVASMLRAWAKEFRASWNEEENSSDEYGDETDFFFSGNEDLLEENMLRWLKALCGNIIDDPHNEDLSGIALCMPLEPRFQAEAAAITPLGPRDQKWLEMTARDGSKGKDFFAWWSPGLNAEYYLGRALAQMWTDVRWRPPVNASERAVLEQVVASLDAAYSLNPNLQYPWAEWKEVLRILDEENGNSRSKPRTQAKPTIGYRRQNVTVNLSGGWTITVPGSFSDFEAFPDNSLCAIDIGREIWFTSFRPTNASPSQTFDPVKRKTIEDRPEYLIERDNFIGEANVTKQSGQNGASYFLLSSFNATSSRSCNCTIVFAEAEQRDWALGVWRSIRPPFSPDGA